MSVEQVGPGSVSNSYGVRTTKSKLVYDNTDSYQDVFIPTGSVPVTATPSGPGLEIEDGSDTRSFVTAEMSGGVPTGNFS